MIEQPNLEDNEVLLNIYPGSILLWLLSFQGVSTT